ERLLVLNLGGLDGVAVAVDLVEGQQGGRHAAAGAQEIAPAQPLAAGRLLADGMDPGLVLLLLRRLGRRDELLVGRDPRRDRQRGWGWGMELAWADPHGLCSWWGGFSGEPRASAARARPRLAAKRGRSYSPAFFHTTSIQPFCISSQVCKPQRTSFVASGLRGL